MRNIGSGKSKKSHTFIINAHTHILRIFPPITVVAKIKNNLRGSNIYSSRPGTRDLAMFQVVMLEYYSPSLPVLQQYHLNHHSLTDRCGNAVSNNDNYCIIHSDLSLSLFICVSICPSPFPDPSLSISDNLSICISISVYLSVCLSLSLFLHIT